MYILCIQIKLQLVLTVLPFIDQNNINTTTLYNSVLALYNSVFINHYKLIKVYAKVVQHFYEEYVTRDYFFQTQKVILAAPAWAISLAIEYAVVFAIHDDLVKSINSKFLCVFTSR